MDNDLGDSPRSKTVIKVIGVGGAGGNAIEHMIERGAQGMEFIAINTDWTALQRSRAHKTLQLGSTGLGAGSKPDVAARYAMEGKEQIRELLEGSNLVFITAGMGGGTGTGAAPIVAQIAREMGILTVGVVTKPFSYEGQLCMQRAENGLMNLKQSVDSLIVILNDKLQDEIGEDATVSECFAAADDVLFKACAGITEIIQTPGLIGVDFEDLRTVMSERGTAMMGSATAKGPERARIAAEQAVACPLLEGVTLNGARGVLVYITASEETMKLKETITVMNVITNFTAKGAQIIQGSAYDDSMGDEMRVTIVATGLENPQPAADDATNETSAPAVFRKKTPEAAAPVQNDWNMPTPIFANDSEPKAAEPVSRVDEQSLFDEPITAPAPSMPEAAPAPEPEVTRPQIVVNPNAPKPGPFGNWSGPWWKKKN
ncbi:MAG TPA: cell division protein FtsZ [Sutterella sp.]|nr:cell division protein FtsZ [Sutterella sp.]